MHEADGGPSPLHVLADAAGLARTWQDVHGRTRTVRDETLEALLDALGLECGDGARLECSLRRLQEEDAHIDGRMIVAEAGRPIVFRHAGTMRYRLEYETSDSRDAHDLRGTHGLRGSGRPDELRGPGESPGPGGPGGAAREGEVQPLGDGRVRLEPVAVAGYHSLQLGKSRAVLAVAPRRCVGPPGRAPWGVAAQVYSLRRDPRSFEGLAVGAAAGAGDYAALAELACQAAGQGADAVAISPVHALFSADPLRYSPYAPSSRLFLNTAYIDVLALGEDALRAALAALSGNPGGSSLAACPGNPSNDALIDWPAVQAARLAVAGELFRQFELHGPPGARSAFEAFRLAGGEALQNHCLYETLHGHYAQTLGPASGWQDWPAPMRDPRGAAVHAFARQCGTELRFHAFLQWLAEEGMLAAQRAARDAGMSIGLIADLAIGTDARGSQAWCAPRDILQGATVGAAPDLYQAQGQNWGLTAFSPRALRQTGFRPFLAMLRHALAHAGGVRIDHVLGLARMWLVPQGVSAAEGAFLRYPLDDMLRLLALESNRHQAIVVGENLGTVPPGFNDLLSGRGVLGTRVLWFEREDHPPRRFVPVERWPADSMATTTTHDLPTVAGWWQGRDLDWQHRLGYLGPEALEAARAEREEDKRLLAQALPSRPDARGGAPVAEVLEWVAGGAAPFCVFPLEDLLALPEQPNLPGPCRPQAPAHPNWLRRLPFDASRLFASPAAAKAVHAVRHGRSRP